MTLIIAPEILLLASLAAVLWLIGDAPLRAWYALLAAALRARLERSLGVRIVYVVGDVRQEMAEEMFAVLDATPPAVPIAVLIDSNGGGVTSAEFMARALARRARVFAYVPARAWSSGTHVALTAEIIAMGPNANLGPCDPWTRIASDNILCGPVLQAHAEAIDQTLLRARDVADEVAESIDAALRARGKPESDARELARKMTSGELGDHYRPIFIEEARALGLPVAPLADPRWATLARWRLLSLPEHLR